MTEKSINEKGSFLLGVNYWASNAGADMWRNWDEQAVEKDLALLRENGIEVLRVFPNWRDFQPVEPAFGGSHGLYEYRMAGDDIPVNPCYLDETMLIRFERFCRMAQEKGLKLIVGLITGWMSGRLYIPSALFGKNLYTDPTALYFQQLFVRGFVSRMKAEESILAWDLGNECNCMDKAVHREESCCWSSVVVNAVRACDGERPIVSGMHSLELEGVWNIQDQGEMTDILTTHPYPFWVEHCLLTPLDDFRTLLHATAQTQYYSTVGKKPCLVEELGSMGPMVCAEEKAAGFLKVNLWSNWVHGAPGLLWWCAHEQSHLDAPPYDWNMCERELGMTDRKHQPKPTLLQMKEFRKELDALQLILPYRETDGICILSRGQDHWGIAYMSYLLAKQAGITLDFAYCEQELPDSGLYFLPSASMAVMSKRRYEHLKWKVYEGAVLYISINDGIFTEFEELTGFTVVRAYRVQKEGCVMWDDEQIPYKKPYQIEMEATRAEVLLSDENENPLFGVAQYGKGKIFFLNFPVEEMLLTEEKGLDKAYYRFYQAAAGDIWKTKGIHKNNPYVGITFHRGKDRDYIVLVNYTAEEQKPGLSVDSLVCPDVTVLRGSREAIEPYGAVILTCGKKG